jgi:hypothetical protein
VNDHEPKAGGVQEFVVMLAAVLELTESYPEVEKLEHELAKQFQMETEEKLQELAEDINQNGLIEKIVLYEDKILDGRNRYEAFKRKGRQFSEAHFVLFDELSGVTPECYVISRNIKRRQMTPGQLAAWAHEYEERRKDAERRQPSTRKSEDHKHTALQDMSARETASRAEVAPSPIGDGLFRGDEKSSRIRTESLRPDKEHNAQAAAVTGASLKSYEQFGHLKIVAPELAAEVKAGSKTLHAARKEAARKTTPKPRRMSTETKAVMEHEDDSLTMHEVFERMLSDGHQTLEVKVIGKGRAIFVIDADIKPQIPSPDQVRAYATEKKLDLDCSLHQVEFWTENGWLDGNRTPILNWKSKLLHFGRGGFGQFSRLEQKKPQPQRAPQGRSTAKTVEEHNRAAAAQERAMQASLAREASRQGKDGQWKH